MKHHPDISLSQAMRASLANYGITQLTPIQEQCLPVLLEGQDLIGQAPTGTGKTLAYAVPLVENLRPGTFALEALVLCPTRELCAQVASEVRKVGRQRPQLRVLSLAGGQPIDFQIRDLRKSAQIVVGTPGRILDLLRREAMTLRWLRMLVIDEADRMLDMGFVDAITDILNQAPRDRQTVLFSATFPDEVLELSQRFQRPDTPRVTVSEDPSGYALPDTLRHCVRECGENRKFETLEHMLRSEITGSALIFCNTKLATEELAVQLIQRGLPVDRLHGDMLQERRDRTMVRFRNGTIRVLVATDVAARGLDISALDAVINYELPQHIELYIHRAGRAGRADKPGLAISLAIPKDATRLGRLQEALGRTFEPLAPTAARSRSDHKPHVEREWETICIRAGRKQKLRPADILGALTGEGLHLRFEQVGKIEIQDHRSFVAVEKSVARKALHCLREGRIKGRRFEVSL
jgi:ATP-independent RNA helicase DbpA